MCWLIPPVNFQYDHLFTCYHKAEMKGTQTWVQMKNQIKMNKITKNKSSKPFSTQFWKKVFTKLHNSHKQASEILQRLV